MYHCCVFNIYVVAAVSTIGYKFNPLDFQMQMYDFSAATVSREVATAKVINRPVVDLMLNRTLFDYCSLENYSPASVDPLLRYFNVTSKNWIALCRYDEG